MVEYYYSNMHPNYIMLHQNFTKKIIKAAETLRLGGLLGGDEENRTPIYLFTGEQNVFVLGTFRSQGGDMFIT